MKLKSLTLLAILALSSSCVDLSGTMRVSESLNVKIKSGFLNLKKKEITLSPGTYSAELKLKSVKNANIKLSGSAIGNITIPIKSDSNLSIPGNGRFRIDGGQIEQPFNIDGHIQTEISRYGYASGYETCTYNFRRTSCERVCYTNSGGGRDGERHGRPDVRCENVCREVMITQMGSKHVSYHYKKTDRLITLDIMKDNSTYIAATFNGSSSEDEKIIDSESMCR